jgi:outer membrane protein TolC
MEQKIHRFQTITSYWDKHVYHTRDLMAAKKLLLFIFLLPASVVCFSQNTNAPKANNDAPQTLTLKQCIDYAMQHQPSLQQSLINISVAKATNAINKSLLYPQVTAAATYTNYLQLPTSFSSVSSQPIKAGVVNTLLPTLAVSQALFSPALNYAIKTSPLLEKAAQQTTDSVKIELVSAVSKSFYSLLLNLEQIDVLKEDTVRLAQNLRDSYHQYVGGIVDETDYEQATITLNNSVASLRQATENVTPQYAALKQLLGYPSDKQFNISFDTTQMAKEIDIDTASQLQYDKRIELKQLATTQSLQHELTNYYHNAAWPTVSAFFDYIPELENNKFDKMFNSIYPYSYIGLTASVPIFTGFARTQSVHRSELQERELGWSVVGLKSEIYSEYTTALANYKSNLYNMQELAKNEELAKRVYFVVKLQYKQGIVAYLNVITAESNLITAEISYLNALFQVLSSKIDLEKARGEINY